MAGAATPIRVLPAEFPDQAVPSHDATVVVTGHEPSERRARYVARRSPRQPTATR